jgi:hypothetical protein
MSVVSGLAWLGSRPSVIVPPGTEGRTEYERDSAVPVMNGGGAVMSVPAKVPDGDHDDHDPARPPRLHWVPDARWTSPSNMAPKKKSGKIPALHQAACNHHVNVVKALLDAGTDSKIADTGGWTALHFAARELQPEIAKMLLDAGAA